MSGNNLYTSPPYLLILTLVQLPELLAGEVVLWRQDGDVVGVVAALLDEAGLAPPPLQRPPEVEAAHLARPPVLAVRVLCAGPHVVVGVVGGVPTPCVDTPQPRPTLPVVRTTDSLTETSSGQ